MERRFILFNQIVTTTVDQCAWPAQVSAIAFSDSFFLATNGLQELLSFCAQLMVTLIANGIPVRMGIARGSFCVHGISQSATAMRRLNVVQFLGSGVVRAYRAESCGLKGLRIAVHRSVMESRRPVGPEIVVPVSADERRAFGGECAHEFNYVHPVFFSPVFEAMPDQVTRDVREIRRRAGVTRHGHAVHYTRTLEALERMKQAARSSMPAALSAWER